MLHSIDRLDSVFAAAVELATLAERDAYLDRCCADNPTLRARVEALLRAHDHSGQVLDRPRFVAGEATRIGADRSVRSGEIIAGRYKLLELIGEGGMGTVWIAEQIEPVRRKVALKLIKPGMDSRSVLARFEAERQALALMDHPNIAKVLDGGVTDEGHPFFVMEYVKGLPITDFCDQVKVTIAGRLNLFVQVCQAVQHAHQKGIIHRDLKPSNILVCLYDGQPVPKIIDFGLAKAMHQPLTEHTLFTAHGLMVGTPLYMSPEQAEFNNLDIDTRSDIYSLGVILYELLTGTTPMDRQRFKDAAWQEIVRLIKEEEPSKPSTKLSGSASLPTVAAQRCLEPPQLRRLIRGDLDWIVMKSLEKERSRRYETANGLARDLQRYLADEVVEARPPSAGYRLRKLVRRHQGAVIAAGLIVLALVAGITGTTWEMIRAVNAQEAEKARAEGERLAKLEAEAANQQAQKRLAQIEKGNEIITSIFSDLDVGNVQRTGEPLAAVLARRLEQSAGQLEGEAIGDPLVVAGLQDRLGLSLMSLGHPQSAIPLFVKSRDTRRSQLGQDHPDTLKSMHDLARAYMDAGRLDLCLPVIEQTFTLRKAKLGADHSDTLRSMNNLAIAYLRTDQLNLALPLFEQIFKVRKASLGPDHPDTLASMSNLAVAYDEAGKSDLALKLKEQSLNLKKARLGADHPDTLISMHNLGVTYATAGKWDLALPLYEETLRRRRATLGADHPDTLSSMDHLATGYAATGQRDRGLALDEEALKRKKAALGSDHPETLMTMHNLASLYSHAGKWDLARPLYEETLKLKKTKFGENHPDTQFTSRNLAEVYMKEAAYQAWLNRGEAYAETCQRALEIAKNCTDPTTLERAAKICSLTPDADRSRGAEAIRLARKAVELGKDHGSLPWFQMALGMSEFRAGRWQEADAALGAAMIKGKQDLHVGLTSAFYDSMALFRLGKQDEARKLAAEATSKMQSFRPYSREKKTKHGHDDLILWMAYKEAIQLLHLGSLAPEKLAEDSESIASLESRAEAHLSAAAHQAWAGQDKEYGETCRLALELGKGSDDPITLERISKACLLRPGGDAARLATALAFARKAVERGKTHGYAHFFLMTLGMAEYRSAHWAEADTAFVAAMRDENNMHIRLTSSFYRAMSLFRQGKRDEARKLATEAAAQMKPLPDQNNGDLDHNDLIVWMAYKEARDLLKREFASPSPGQSAGK